MRNIDTFCFWSNKVSKLVKMSLGVVWQVQCPKGKLTCWEMQKDKLSVSKCVVPWASMFLISIMVVLENAQKGLPKLTMRI